MVFKRYRCHECGKITDDKKPGRIPPACPKCSSETSYLEKWYIQWTEQGKRKTRAVSSKKKDAEAELGKRLSSIAEGRSTLDKVKRYTWEEAVSEFEDWYTVNTKSKRMFDYAVKMLTLSFKDICINDIDVQQVEKHKTKRVRDGVSASTINKEIMTLKRMQNLLIGHTTINRVRKLEEPSGRVRVLTDEEQKTLFNEVRSDLLRVAIYIGLNTGLRKANVMGLKWEDISWPEGVIRTRLVKKKTSPLIAIPMTAKLIAELKRYRDAQNNAVLDAESRVAKEKGVRLTKAKSVLRNAKIVASSPFLFPSPTRADRPMRPDADIGFTSACERAGITDFRFHDLRHTFASKFAMATGDIGTLRDLLGHSDISMTMRYSHFSVEHKKSRMAQFEQFTD